MELQLLPYLFTAFRQFRQRDGWTREQIEANQQTQLAALRRHAYAHSPFYQRFHEGYYDRPLYELPVLKRDMLVTHFDDIISDRAVQLEDVKRHLQTQPGTFMNGKYLVAATSGSTTGDPGVFLFDKADWANIIISLMRVYQWGKLDMNPLKRRRIAFVVSSSPWHMTSQVSQHVHTSLINTIRISATEPLAKIVEQLNTYNPHTLITYASMARLLAVEAREGRLKIKPENLLSTSEVLSTETRAMIESVWGNIVLDQYAATEVGGLASECSQHEGKHMYEDMLIIENVDNDYKPVPIGEYGERLLVTALLSRTLPLIRYEVSDSVRIIERKCSCGRAYRLIDSVQGRVEDVLEFPGIRGGKVFIHPIVIHSAMGIVLSSGWQVIQRGNGLVIRLSGALAEDGAQVERTMRNALEQHGAKVGTITVEKVEQIPRNANGKMSYIKREAPVNSAAAQ